MTFRAKAIVTALAIVAAPAIASAQTIGVDAVADGFDAPVFVTAPANDDRLFVVDQDGQIWIVDDGARLDVPFLNISGEVWFAGEMGLLGLAFHPNYARNGRFFVNYVDRSQVTRIVEYRTSTDPNQAAPETAREIISLPQPAGNHNGGWIGFGPDGYLYIATGDGGGAGDTFNTGQNPDSLLAKILRIDIDNGDPYAIPRGNPWADGGGVPEAFLWGLRNPWRASFDGNDLYIGDVGQGDIEEIDVVNVTTGAGTNFGWSVMEGTECFRGRTCNADGALTLPVHEYTHRSGCSVAGGYVYRGSAIPSLVGHYFFGDYCSGFVHSFRYADGQATELADWSGQVGDIGRILSFGHDAAGEIYITSSSGRIYKIVPR
jgi:glucose/arabinose dehydrogenase